MRWSWPKRLVARSLRNARSVEWLLPHPPESPLRDPEQPLAAPALSVCTVAGCRERGVRTDGAHCPACKGTEPSAS